MSKRNLTEPSTVATPLPAQLSAQWVRKASLGAGGQASVTEIQHRDTNERRALKMLKREDDYDRMRLAREIDVLHRLQHENIIALLDHADDKSWYVMPLGIPLKTHWKSRRGTPAAPRQLFDEALLLIRGVLAGLAAAHTLDLVHRDIKPANVLIIDGVARVADFGIVHDPTQERLTERPAANNFAPYVPSLYDPRYAPKLIDSFGAATLWAWMLAADPHTAHGRYHWRWHTFIDDPRCEVVRALLAVCSDEQHAPVDAGATLDFLERELGLASWPMVDIEDDIAAKVAEAQAIGRARATEERMVTEGLVTTIAWSISAFINAVIAHCERLAEQLRAQGAEIYLRHSTEWDLTSGTPVTKSVRDLVTLAASRPGKDHAIFTLSTQRSPRDPSMRVSVFVHWHENPHEDGSKISLGLAFEHRIPELRQKVYFKVLPGGTVLGESWDTSTPVDALSITKMVDAFFLEPNHHI